MIGQLALNGCTYVIKSAELHLPRDGDSHWLYMLIIAEPDDGFALWGVQLPLLRGLDDLHGQRLHVQWQGEVYPDDTLGTDVGGADVMSDLNYWHGSETSYAFVEVQVDFERIDGRRYRCRVALGLFNPDADPPLDVTAGPAVHAIGEFVADADEVNPIDE